jgi:hypothetical protein
MSHTLCRQPLGLLHILTRGPWPEVKREQGLDGRVPARGVTGGEVRGEGKSQGLTVVRLHHVSRFVVVGKGDLDESPKQRRRGQRRR